MFSKALLLFTLFTAASSVLAQPHAHRGMHMRHARHVAADSSLIESINAPLVRRKSKRALSNRCMKPVAEEPAPSSIKVSIKSIEAPAPPKPTTAAAPSKSSSASKPEETETDDSDECDDAPEEPEDSDECDAPEEPEESESPKPTTSTRQESSTKAEPKPTTINKDDDPKPTTTKKDDDPKPTTTKKDDDPKPTKKPSSGPSFLTGTNSGQGTFYDTGLTACGVTNNNNQFIAAVSKDLFDVFPGATANPNKNPVCGRKVTATYKGKSVTVTITDRCEGCKLTDLDFSPAAFNKLADPSLGRISGVTWHFL